MMDSLGEDERIPTFPNDKGRELKLSFALSAGAATEISGPFSPL